jgi:hypothetical protein
MSNNFSLTDPFRALNPNKQSFSYSPFGTQRKNRSRIDFFITSTSLLENITRCEIFSAQLSTSFDHKPIYLSFKETTQPKSLKKGVITNWFLDDPLIKMSAELAALQVYSHSIDSTAHPEIVNDLRLNINVLTAKILDCCAGNY